MIWFIEEPFVENYNRYSELFWTKLKLSNKNTEKYVSIIVYTEKKCVNNFC